jgi:hypothetical protein
VVEASGFEPKRLMVCWTEPREPAAPRNKIAARVTPGGVLRLGGSFFSKHRRRVLVPLVERLSQPEFDFRAQRTHLAPRLCGQQRSQIIVEADREAPILIRVVSHRNPLVGWRPVGACPHMRFHA